MKFSLLCRDTTFLITNADPSTITDSRWKAMYQKEWSYLFGYCFSQTDLLKNQKISISQYDGIARTHEENSGLFCAIKYKDGDIELTVDPLTQYNLFYINNNGLIALGSSKWLRIRQNLSETILRS